MERVWERERHWQQTRAGWAESRARRCVRRWEWHRQL